MKTKFIIVLLMFFTLGVSAMGLQEDTVDYTVTTSWVLLLTPVIVLASTWLFKKLSPLVSGTVTLLVVAGLSGLLVAITSWIGDTNNTWWVQFLLGLGAVFINQLYRQFTNSNR